MLYVESRKSFKARSEKNLFICRVQKTLGKLISLLSATNGHSTKFLTAGTLTYGCPHGGLLPSVSVLPSVFFLVYRVFFFNTRQRVYLPSAIILPSVFFFQ